MRKSVLQRAETERRREERERGNPAVWLTRSPAWAIAAAMHILAAVILMNVVHFVRRPIASGFFRVSFHAPARPAEPPGGARQGDQDNGVNGKDNEDAPPAGPPDPADPSARGTRTDLPDAPRIAPSLPGSKIAKLPGLGVSGKNGLGGLYAGRGGAGRGDALRRHGGDAESERAVAEGLAWLAEHQEEDGSWRPGRVSRHCPEGDPCTTTRGDDFYGTGAATGLAVLAFLGAGHSQFETGETPGYASTVRKGLEYLASIQDKSGGLDPSGGRNMYIHGICAFALTEAWALTQDPDLRRPAELAVGFIVEAQQSPGGWNYTPDPGLRGDTSITSWQVMALRSARAGALPVPESAWKRARAYMELATNRHTGNIAYGVSGEPGSTFAQPGCNMMTAAGMVTRLYLGFQDDHVLTGRFTDDFARVPPRFDAEQGSCPNWGRCKDNADDARHWSLYYTYYATLAAFHHGGDVWQKWNAAMRRCTLGTQNRQGHRAGSWEPATWDCMYGGAIYATAFNVMNLEVYYRYLPCYQEGAESGLAPMLGDAEWARADAARPSLRRTPGNGAFVPAAATMTDADVDKAIGELKSPDMLTRRNAARALSAIRDEKVLAALLAAARAEKTSLRQILMEQIAAHGDGGDVLDFFISELRHEKPEVRKSALAALRKLTGQWMGEDASLWEKWRAKK